MVWITYTREDTDKSVLEVANGVGVDAVFDNVGKGTLDNNFKLSKGKGTLVSFGNTSGAVPPFSPLMLAENIKLLRPGVMSYMVTHCPKSFNVVSKGIAKINTFHKYPFAAKSVQQAQTDLSRGKPTGKSIVKIGD